MLFSFHMYSHPKRTVSKLTKKLLDVPNPTNTRTMVWDVQGILLRVALDDLSITLRAFPPEIQFKLNIQCFFTFKCSFWKFLHLNLNYFKIGEEVKYKFFHLQRFQTTDFLVKNTFSRKRKIHLHKPSQPIFFNVVLKKETL